AMQALLEAARVELAPHGVAVTKINPGFIRTAMTAKNRFPMPFLMDVEPAARRIADAIESRRKELSFPLPMALFVGSMRLIPKWLWDRGSLPYAKAKSRSR
ncbi:MAG TPA: short-chain dehydrogenase, partial [Thermoanaerobaculia bacterium]|nr:short-chain dehydrogenase [Thermoanaerobaculia bacterium]